MPLYMFQFVHPVATVTLSVKAASPEAAVEAVRAELARHRRPSPTVSPRAAVRLLPQLDAEEVGLAAAELPDDPDASFDLRPLVSGFVGFDLTVQQDKISTGHIVHTVADPPQSS